MKRINIILVLLTILAVNYISYADSLYVYPSSYYTFGQYSNSNYSKSIAGYITLNFNLKTYLTLGYDNLKIDYNTGNYLQKNYTVSLLKNYFPSYLKGSYSYIKGTDTKSGSSITSDDVTHLASVEYYLFNNMFYYGLSGTYIEQSGLTSLQAFQITPKVEWVFSKDLYLSIKPNFTYVNDNRNLFSVAGYVSWNALENFYIKVKGFIGKRALYFDTDLLTIYNQNDTQKKLYSLQLDYIAFKNYKISAGYQHSDFSYYYIDYYHFGISTAIKF